MFVIGSVAYLYSITFGIYRQHPHIRIPSITEFNKKKKKTQSTIIYHLFR